VRCGRNHRLYNFLNAIVALMNLLLMSRSVRTLEPSLGIEELEPLLMVCHSVFRGLTKSFHGPKKVGSSTSMVESV